MVIETENIIHIEVAYAEPSRQEIIPLEAEPGTTAIDAVMRSGIMSKFESLASIDQAESLELGIFSKQCAHDYVMQEGDRVEIYRPLLIDPKEARRLKAEVEARRQSEAKSE